MTPNSRTIPLNQIETRRPDTAGWETVVLGGINLYAKDGRALTGSLDRLQQAIETALKSHFCLIRQVLRSVVKKEVEEEIPDRIFGAVLGRALRHGAVTSLACLTPNGKILRIYLHASRQKELDINLKLILHLLKSQTALSVMAAQAACFPNREWATRYMSQQLLGHLALRGLAVFVDKDLLSWPKVIEHAVGTNHK
jgi:hypothetical protein